MTFTVKYRAIDGKMREECIEAASRSECVSKCKAQGITPISVKEGGKVSNAETQRREERKIGGKLLWIISGVVILGGVLWWFFGRQNEVTVKAEKPKSVKQVKQVKPKAEPKPMTNTPAVKAEAKSTKVKPRRVGEICDGYVLLPSGDLYKVTGVVTTQVASTSIADKTFKHNAERQIAHLLLVEPGEGMLGSGEDLYSDFDKEFKESLKDEIAFDENDTPEQHELKKALIDIRKELIERMNKGEDLSHVMIETRKQLQEMSLYKNELHEEVMKLRKDGNLSKQDRLDLLEAANKMLEERGIQPFLIPSSLQKLIDVRESQNKGN
jgi:hypothetical protein